MKQLLRQIYRDVCGGRLSQDEALRRIKAMKQEQGQGAAALLARPVWEPSDVEALAGGEPSEYAEHYVMVCELARVEGRRLESLLAGSGCVLFRGGEHVTLAQRYGAHALACFERVQAVLQGRPQGKVLVQVVAAGDPEGSLVAGLSGLLRTAAAENPQLVGQVILVPAQVSGEELAQRLESEKRYGREALVRYEGGERRVLRWHEVVVGTEEPPLAFSDRGVYLITGGLGGLGVVFAREILERTLGARVVLTGRSALSAEKQACLDGLSADAGRVSYRQLDVLDLEAVEQLVGGVQDECGPLSGILHCAGMIADSFVLKKSSEQFREVLGPKVTGTLHLDQASRGVALDFFVLFSSMASALGNVGQADYAAANGFMDQFAAYRNGQVAAGLRHGRTRSIHWPLWQSGGMGVDPEVRERLERTTGIGLLRTGTGLRAFHRILGLPYDRVLVAEGELWQMRRALLGGLVSEPGPKLPAVSGELDSARLVEQAQDYLRQQLSGLLKLPAHKIDPQAALEKYGIDSILAMKLTNQLEATFGTLPKTLFFEYQTLGELAVYFAAQHAQALGGLFAVAVNHASDVSAVVAPAVPVVAASAAARPRPGGRFSRLRSAAPARSAAPSPASGTDPIAIIGLSGRYPEAVDLEAYWQNLREGKDCIVEVPKERWDWREYFSEDRTRSGHHYSKWGGFMSGVDEFDPLFFGISPKDAKYIDPQERLFLLHAWMAVEDAGYTRTRLQLPSSEDLPGQVGVYVGVMYSEYQLFGAEANARGQRMGVAGSPASIANRVSYALNLHGPSMTLDTMCSSSLTAIHIACQDLRQGRTSLALAGGVNVSIHPNKYLVLSAGQFISSDGHCQSFGEGGDGYIPGEGVGVVVLKRLSEAERDGDHIYGILRGSALNHGGKTNGYTVPNPQAQASAISRALAESGTDARHISYIEAHGTGTKLGDPIEIAALSKAFRQYTQDAGYCLVGSAKSNIGHCESAAGIAGLTKVLLQMEHRQIVPSLHSAQLNPHIDFDETPFVVNQALRAWEPPVIDGQAVARIAGISSFGAGGSNAHVIVEEYRGPARAVQVSAQVAVVLSARTAEQLRQKARDLVGFVRPRLGAIDLVALAYTLQVGREAMDERLGLVVGTAEELVSKLEAYVAGDGELEDGYQGQVKRHREALSLFSTDVDLRETVDKWMVQRKLSKLLELWAKGLELNWSRLYGDVKPQRISLPTYPFARERYWVEVAGDVVGSQGAAKSTTTVLHPLLHANTSDLNEQRYSSTFTGDEFFLSDHQLKDEAGGTRRVLPGVTHLEMVRAAIEQAWPGPAEDAVLELRHVVWAQPIVVTHEKQVNVALLATDDEQVDYEIYSQDAGDTVAHGQGRAVWSRRPAPERLDLQRIKAQLAQALLEPDRLYAALAHMGIIYGPALRAVTAIEQGSGQVLAQLRLPAAVESSSSEYVLHPSLLDGALQACAGLMEDLPAAPRVPFALETLRILSACRPEMVAWVRYSPGSQAADKVVKLDIDLCDADGNICVQMHALSTRLLSADSDLSAAPGQEIGCLMAAPVWQASRIDASADASAAEYAAQHVILCETRQVDRGELESLLVHSRCVALRAEEPDNVARRYSEHALACFERIQAILQSKPRSSVLVQLVCAGDPEGSLFAGLSGLLKTAALENPQLVGQLILVPPDMGAGELARRLEDERSYGRETLVRYEHGQRQVMRWQEASAGAEGSPLALQERGVYLVTGGLGGLGLVFAREILERTSHARVILAGRSALDAERQARLETLSAAGRVSYRGVDLGDLEAVKQLIGVIRDEHGQLDGILHCAGMLADSFILKKSSAQFREVLAPKVTGTFNLDQASGDVALDFFVLFSSLTSAIGNLGQADYAAANGFMDRFAAYRNGQVAKGLRHGRTRSIHWPLWQAGGMGVDAETREQLARTTGIQAMRTETGVRALYRSLALPYDEMLVAEGDLRQMRRVLLAGPAAPQPRPRPAASASAMDSASLAEKSQDYLRQQLSGLLKLPAHKIDPQAPLEQYGIDSIIALKLTNRLEETFGSLSKTLLFEYQTVAALAGYFTKAHSVVLTEITGHSEGALRAERPLVAVRETRRPAPSIRRRTRALGAKPSHREEIAVVGLAGRYPQARNLQEFWKNLRDGRDCIEVIPPERWDHTLFYDPDKDKLGKSYSKWGGFIADVDRFDPLFFGISPKEAELIDPQERVFLETAWQTIEDAGYTRDGVRGMRAGVYVGVMWGQYELFGAESILQGSPVLPSSSHASIANRVSYFFDLRGPSLAVDTMCSSSLTAIHLACEELRKGGIDAAIAGGVNLTLHPYKYLSLSQGRFAASDGRCRTFGQGGDGYVPGEGVGAVLLKPLEAALRDGDQIYAVIRSSAVNHGGKTNGYTVPNPNAQAELIQEALRKADVDPRSLGYVEAHGTGTSLGDPIEITGLTKAFEGATDAKQFCPIGSVKSNIGHLESAAGIAAVTKVLLQMRHKQLVPSLHAEPRNPNINFGDSPFYVQTELAEWRTANGHPRRAGVSSFGAGGSNAHLILEEWTGSREPQRETPPVRPEVFLLSARDEGALGRHAERLIAFLDDAPADLSLADAAYTSQVGRTPMDARLAIVASTLTDLRDKLNRWTSAHESGDGRSEDCAVEVECVFQANAKEAAEGAGSLINGQAGKTFLESVIAERDVEKLAKLWLMGVDVDWPGMHRDAGPRRVSLPTYPFARERCWLNQPPARPGAVRPSSTDIHAVAPARPAEAKRTTLYQPRWTSKALVGPQEGAFESGAILVLDASDELFLALKQRDERTVWLKPGEEFRELAPDMYVLDPGRAEQFDEVLGRLESRGRLPGIVLHHSAPACDIEVQEQVARQLEAGVYALFHLCQASIKMAARVPLKILSVFSSRSKGTAPVAAAISGFGKTLTLEHPRYLAKVVELRSAHPAEEPPVADRAAALWDELHGDDWTAEEIRYEFGAPETRPARYVREWLPLARRDADLPALPLRQNGVYLITGGLGGLGLIFAEYLAKAFQAKLILVGRSRPTTRQDESLEKLRAHGAEVLVLQADVSRLEDVQRVVREAKARFSAINGVLHAAGVHRDALILNKTKESVEEVLAPKVYGAVHVDAATRDEALDWFVLFSSVAGVLGSPGQSDYAFGNRFLDAFAEQREELRRAQVRSGRSLSIAWPLWEEGGMRSSRENTAVLEEQTGICALPTAQGLRCWEDLLRSDAVQAAALYGVPSRVAAVLAPRPAPARRDPSAALRDVDGATLATKVEEYLKVLIGEELKLAPERIGSSAALEAFGIDSVTISRITTALEKNLGPLPKTLLYEHGTVKEVAKFLIDETRPALVALLGVDGSANDAARVSVETEAESVRQHPPRTEYDEFEPMAVVGIHGRYPRSATLEEYWSNLRQGRDLIDVVPATRWDSEAMYHPDPAAASKGKIYCKWGGFLDDHDKFDPQFFGIPEAEARFIDPQERLVLESVWAAIEDAGYTRESLKKRYPKGRSADVGVFVGVTTNSYHLWAPEERNRGHVVAPSSLPWSVANRVSYFFDFNGPSLPVDTACSSSLVALHLACESLRKGECKVAIAGGVNLYLHPAKYQSLCQGRMLSLDGRCHSYGAGGEGWVPGEGVGTVVLKPLSQAVQDRDRIHAVIRATAFSHSGRSHGYSAPNPHAQAALIAETLTRARVHPDTIGYVEGHGTGTQLGDSLEVVALTQAFERQTARRQFCPIGSVKANIGHSESAAGMAGLAKVILQMRHGQLAPSIHSGELNPDIDFEASPFYPQHEAAEWTPAPGHPRRALINAFGAGGVSACVIVDEYGGCASVDGRRDGGRCVFALSARTAERLEDYALRVLARLRGEPAIDLASLCYTLQVGREALEERLATVVSGLPELVDRLSEWSRAGSATDVCRGSVRASGASRRRGHLRSKSGGEPSLTEIASAWLAGEEVDWESLYPDAETRPRRMGLPTYPFARQRYWFSDSLDLEKSANSEARLHPFISHNSSTLDQFSFSATLSDAEFYAVDHVVNGEPIFPGAGLLEMACIAGNLASERRVRRITDVTWISPLSFRQGPRALRIALVPMEDRVEYAISSVDEENDTVVHSEGRLDFTHRAPHAPGDGPRASIQSLKDRCRGRAESGSAFYEALERYGLHYGPAFRSIREIHAADACALAKLELPSHLQGGFGQFILHPSLLDGALQAAGALVDGGEATTPHLPFAVDEVEIVRVVPSTCYAYVELAEATSAKRAGLKTFNIHLLNEDGERLVSLKNLLARPMAQAEVAAALASAGR